MAQELEHEALDVRGPKLAKSHVLAVTSSSASTDMSASAAIGTDLSAGRMLRLHADGGDVYYAWSTDGTGTIDDTATGAGATVCGVIPAGQFRDERPPFDVTATITIGRIWPFLYYKTASGTAKLRVTITSMNRTQQYR